MEKISFKFYLNELRGHDEKYPIYLRVIVNRLKAEMATEYLVDPKDWNDKKQRTKKSDGINEGLNKIEDRIYEVKNLFIREGKDFSAGEIKNALTNRNENVKLLERFQEHTDKLQKGNEVEASTISIYLTAKEYLSKFITAKHKLSDFNIRNIDHKFVSDFDQFLLEKKLKRNTINKYHKKLKTVLIKSFNEGVINKNPYTSFKLKTVSSTRTYLELEELERITNHPLANNESLIKVRDIFIFSVYTGLRFTDAINLTMGQVNMSDANNSYIMVYQEKTSEPVMIPLLPQAKLIIEKYNLPERKVTGKVLPEISNQKLNAYLKTIADLAQIKKVLTHHVARHTCATTVLLNNKVPMEAVSKWLGHKSIKNTQVYAKISNQYLRNEADKLGQIFK